MSENQMVMYMNGKCVRKLPAFLLAGLLVFGAMACAKPEEAAPGEQDAIPTETQNRSVAVEGYEKLCWLDDNTLYLARKEREENDTTLVLSRYTMEDDRLEEVLREEWADFGLEKFVCADTGTDRVIFTGDALLMLAQDERPGQKTGLREQYGHMTDYNATRQQLAYVEPGTGDLYICELESGAARLCYSSSPDETEGRKRYLYYPKQSPNGDKIACTVSMGDLAIYDSVVCVTAEGKELFTISPIEKPEGSSLVAPELAWWSGNLVLIQTNEIENEWYGTAQVFDGNNGQLLDSFRVDGNLVCMGNGICSDGKIPFVSFDVEEWRYDVGVVNLKEK